ncbi:hypothetical protein L210DRAFT_3619795 [Boletus edulis BED1]|uniref:LIM zinc-binding domain-containing protein n=1 Tax=Boletus edulis BED1 TaxID=1328754 RepID=A0AAD4GIL9_BOLED|nr:hypothetical protein L210DRAFT_3619795 [Boletus edulis BED1]
MGFCRRCGDIVTGTRCKCGGTAVAPVLQWTSSKCQTVDKWSQTYISKDKSPTRSPVQIDGTASISSRLSPFIPSHINSHGNTAAHSPSPPKRSFDMDERSPPSSPTTLAAETGILQAPNAPELSKLYGSVLQPKQSLATYSCAICLTEFQPDATIFPDPSAPELSDRFLCRPCFIINGGSKGDCPVCRRPVLTLKSEGGFVETSGRVWHKKCFRCEECQKNIGDTPMVDLLGKPSCVDCFDSCLKRNSTPRKSHPSLSSEKADNRTPVGLFKDSKSREGSPTINELEQRLGIMKSREGSPVLEELTQRLNAVLNRPSRDSFPSPSFSTSQSNKDDRESSPLVQRILEKKKSAAFIPSHHGIDPVDIFTDPDSIGEMKTTTPFQATPADRPSRDCAPPSIRPSFDAIEEMKNRIMNQVTSSPVTTDATSSPGLLSNSMNSSVSTPSRIPRMSRLSGSPGLRHAVSTSSLWSSRMSRTPSTPDLIPDISDTLTQSSGPSSPPTCSPRVHPRDDFSNNLREHTPSKAVALERPASGTVTPKPRDSLNKSSIPTATLSSGSLCAKCGGSLFATGGSGRFVTVPELNANGPPKTYHTECFRCALCDGPFRETANGQAVFVRGEGGACHIECAPPEKTTIKSASMDSTFGSPLVPLTNTILTSKLDAGMSHGQQPKGSPRLGSSQYSSSRYERPPPLTPSLSSSSRFGSSAACPGCQKAVSPMEMGVVPGPQGSRWHATCLLCGGKGTGKGRRDKSQPGCGKRLDSAARRDVEGGVWCRECLLLLPLHMRNSQVETPLKPLTPSYTGRSAKGGLSIAPQVTGTTTIARQFTGRSGGDSGILRQLTGGGLSSTRQLAGSPTKQLGLATPRPRPKSVIGIRSSKSIDEGRGMYLVRQMTGGGGSFAV